MERQAFGGAADPEVFYLNNLNLEREREKKSELVFYIQLYHILAFTIQEKLHMTLLGAAMYVQYTDIQ